jgi:multidrug efflux pump subunit AcrA (membrane-fusion protein)
MAAVSVEKIPARLKAPLGIGAAVLGLGIVMSALFLRARSEVNKTALAAQPKGVTVVSAVASQYRPARRYVGTVAPWLEARIAPQFTAAYVDTVLVRPGDVVQKGQGLATLDCKSASAQSKAMLMQARGSQRRRKDHHLAHRKNTSAPRPASITCRRCRATICRSPTSG